MADYCTDCVTLMFGDDITPDIDVEQIIDQLKPGYQIDPGICEGCGLASIAKTENGKIRYWYWGTYEWSDEYPRSTKV